MPRVLMQQALEIFSRDNFKVLDITGGAVETHPDFEWLLTQANTRNISTVVRTNLAVLEDQRYAHFAELYAKLGVKLVASLPCYTQENVDAQRGVGTFEHDVKALRHLNELGYGIKNSMLELDLVYNPSGPFLPAPQQALEEDYRARLGEQGLSFNHLLTITNMNIGRFAQNLDEQNKGEKYQRLLITNFNESTVEHMMCRAQISVGPDGTLYDCDFNQALNLPIEGKHHLTDYAENPLGFTQRNIIFGPHCFACTAGAGSSCSGAALS